MPKLPAILWGLALILAAIIFNNLWLLLPGLLVLAIGLFWFKWDFPTSDDVKAEEPRNKDENSLS